MYPDFSTVTFNAFHIAGLESMCVTPKHVCYKDHPPVANHLVNRISFSTRGLPHLSVPLYMQIVCAIGTTTRCAL